MMMDPKHYVEQFKNASYQEILKFKNELISDIMLFLFVFHIPNGKGSASRAQNKESFFFCRDAAYLRLPNDKITLNLINKGPVSPEIDQF